MSDVTDDRQRDRLRRTGVCDVLETHGVAVDSGVVERRQRTLGNDVFGENAALRVQESEIEIRQRMYAAEHGSLMFVD
jgi:hypothetical protein